MWIGRVAFLEILMRQMKPSTILLLGGLLTGTITTTAFLITTPGARNPRGFCIEFGIGSVFGLLIFAPIVLAENFRSAISGWFSRHGSRVQPRVAFIMAMALGYLIASMRHHTFDAIAFVAMGLVFITAIFGVVVGTVNGDRKSAT